MVTEVQFETFIDNPIQTFIDIDIQEISFASVGDDMTNDQKEKAQEVVVPIIIASQIIAAGSIIPVRKIK